MSEIYLPSTVRLIAENEKRQGVQAHPLALIEKTLREYITDEEVVLAVMRDFGNVLDECVDEVSTESFNRGYDEAHSER